jgi:hypothetical protein
MAVTLKTRPGVADAGDSYQTRAELETALGDRNITDSYTEAEKDAALREAADYLDATYAYPSTLTSIGPTLKRASSLLAIHKLQGSTLEPMDQSQRIRKRDQSVDVVKDITEYHDPAAPSEGNVYPLIDRLMEQVGAARIGRGIGAAIFSVGSDPAAGLA